MAFEKSNKGSRVDIIHLTLTLLFFIAALAWFHSHIAFPIAKRFGDPFGIAIFLTNLAIPILIALSIKSAQIAATAIAPRLTSLTRRMKKG